MTIAQSPGRPERDPGRSSWFHGGYVASSPWFHPLVSLFPYHQKGGIFYGELLVLGRVSGGFLLGDSMWPFYLLVTWRSLNLWNGHLTCPKRALRIARWCFFTHVFLSISLSRLIAAMKFSHLTIWAMLKLWDKKDLLRSRSSQQEYFERDIEIYPVLLSFMGSG